MTTTTLALQDPQCMTTLHAAAQRAQAAYPDERPRIDKGLQIVLAHQIELLTDGLALVQSQTRPGVVYAVNGVCECYDAARAPEGRCKHKWAKSLLRWTLAHVTEAREQVLRDVVPTSTPGMVEIEPEPVSQGIRVEWLVSIQGKKFIKFAGLLALAHEKGLSNLRVAWTYNDAGLSLAEAVATFPFGTFTEAGDATPENVTKKVAPHFRRVALTRAKARCLRDALNIGTCALEELGDD